jgi:dimethylhistidine N-methyltransferase
MTDAAHPMMAEVLAGLTASPKALNPKFFYDALGSKLFEAITYTPEYYPTDCEVEILHTRAHEIADALGPDVTLVELGSGQSTKVPILLDALRAVHAYVPVDIDAGTLDEAARRLRTAFPDLTVIPVAADFTQPWDLPPLPHDGAPVVFYPGSTIGNLDPSAAQAFLTALGAQLPPRARLLIGVDLEKDPAVLEAAYDDAPGVTAAFNRNMLAHLNRALGADFDPRQFDHRAFYDADAHRIEMHLVSRSSH